MRCEISRPPVAPTTSTTWLSACRTRRGGVSDAGARVFRTHEQALVTPGGAVEPLVHAPEAFPKRLFETSDRSSDDIAAVVGYDNPAFFRRLFKRFTGLTAAQYRRMFRPISDAGQAQA
jgi:hypothetical protein